MAKQMRSWNMREHFSSLLSYASLIPHQNLTVGQAPFFKKINCSVESENISELFVVCLWKI